MTPQNTLDLKGNFQTHPFAELLVEIIQAKLSGSLRVTHKIHKAIIYFRAGSVVYAVSNGREQRLFSVLLERNKIDQKTLSRFPNLANDMELASALEEKEIFTREQIRDFVRIQIESIIIAGLTWPHGDWHFSPLTRLREDLLYDIDVFKVLVEYARCLPSQAVYQRFRSVQEVFFQAPQPATSAVLQPQESYALGQFRDRQLTIEELRPLCSLPETAMLQALYVLWLGGLLIRRDWNSAFSATKIGAILTAKVSLVREATTPVKQELQPEEPAVETETPEPLKPVGPDISLQDYLERVENAPTLYDVLGIAADASSVEIKAAYFAMAKLFHPDRYHREEGIILRRIQVAFTQIAHAYDTLKGAESRESYNFKMRKEIEYREKRRLAGLTKESPEERQTENGLESFEKGLEALSEEEYAAAAGHLSRAAHYSPQNALYHAYLGQALSYLEKQQHRAEASLQAAVKLDPKNPKIRMMLVEFFMEIKMAKRAEGELKRFLELVPGNPEATRMLAKMPGNSPV